MLTFSPLPSRPCYWLWSRRPLQPRRCCPKPSDLAILAAPAGPVTDFKTSNGSVNGEMLSIFCNMVTGSLVNVLCLQGSECYLFQCAVSILSTWVRLFAFGIVLDFSLLLASLSFFSCLFVAIVACAMVSFPLRVIFTIRFYCCFCSILLSVLAMFLMTVYCDCCFDAKSTLL